MSKPTSSDILDVLDRIDVRLDSIDVTLVKQGKDLEYHIARTNLLEEQVKPIRDSHQQVIGSLKLLGYIGLLVAIVEGLRSILAH